MVGICAQRSWRKRLWIHIGISRKTNPRTNAAVLLPIIIFEKNAPEKWNLSTETLTDINPHIYVNPKFFLNLPLEWKKWLWFFNMIRNIDQKHTATEVDINILLFEKLGTVRTFQGCTEQFTLTNIVSLSLTVLFLFFSFSPSLTSWHDVIILASKG